MGAFFRRTLSTRLCLLIASEQNQISKLSKGITESSMEEKLQTIPKVQNLVVARFQDGKMIRGVTHGFRPPKKVFHVSTLEKHGKTVRGKVFEIFLSELKALFFVKSLEGKKGPLSLKGLMEKNWMRRV